MLIQYHGDADISRCNGAIFFCVLRHNTLKVRRYIKVIEIALFIVKTAHIIDTESAQVQ